MDIFQHGIYIDASFVKVVHKRVNVLKVLIGRLLKMTDLKQLKCLEHLNVKGRNVYRELQVMKEYYLDLIEVFKLKEVLQI